MRYLGVRRLGILALAFSWVGIACSREPESVSEETRSGSALENVLLVTLDTTRFDALSCYGAPPGSSPEIDELAEESYRFERAYSATNITNPSHLSILTGLRSIEHGVFNNRVVQPKHLLSLPRAFRKRGGQTAAFPATNFLGRPFGWQGFDEIIHPKGQEYRTADRTAARVCQWLERRDPDKPFFLWVHFFDPHVLYRPPQEIAEKFYSGDPKRGDQPLLEAIPSLAKWDYPEMKEYLRGVRDPGYPKAMYAAEVHFADRHVGEILRALDSNGLRGSTVVVLTADHGESLGEHGVYYDHFGLHEPTIRVPLILRVPGRSGGVVSSPVTNLDVAPTLSELFELGWPEREGRESLMSHFSLAGSPLLEAGVATKNSGERELIVEAARNKFAAVIRGEWKWIEAISPDNPRHVLSGGLFHLGRDPDELNDVSSDFPDVAKDLSDRLRRWSELGKVKASRPITDPAVLRQLKALGYLRD